MREDAPQLLCAHLFTKKKERRKTKNGRSILFPGYGRGRSSFLQTIKNWTPTSPLPFANIQMRKETFYNIRSRSDEFLPRLDGKKNGIDIG